MDRISQAQFSNSLSAIQSTVNNSNLKNDATMSTHCISKCVDTFLFDKLLPQERECVKTCLYDQFENQLLNNINK